MRWSESRLVWKCVTSHLEIKNTCLVLKYVMSCVKMCWNALKCVGMCWSESCRVSCVEMSHFSSWNESCLKLNESCLKLKWVMLRVLCWNASCLALNCVVKMHQTATRIFLTFFLVSKKKNATRIFFFTHIMSCVETRHVLHLNALKCVEMRWNELKWVMSRVEMKALLLA